MYADLSSISFSKLNPINSARSKIRITQSASSIPIPSGLDEPGLYEINLNATVNNPVYSDWGKIYLTVKAAPNVTDKILFIEEFIIGNPECAELQDLVNEAKSLLTIGQSDEALKRVNQALDSCKQIISQRAKIKIKEQLATQILTYVMIGSLIAMGVGLVFYIYQRRVFYKAIKKIERESSLAYSPG